VASLKLYLRQNTEVVVVGLLGITLVIIGAIVYTCCRLAQLSTILVSVGTSLIAAAVVTYLSPVSREVYQKFVGLGISDVFPSRDDIPKRHWCGWIRQAKHRCVLLGIANNNWCGDGDFEPSVLKAVRSGVELKILFLDPTGNAVKTRAIEDNRRDLAPVIRTAIRFIWNEVRNKLEGEPEAQKLLQIYVYDATPSSGMTWIDDRFIVVTHYLAGFANVTSPALIVKPVEDDPDARDLYRTYEENAEAILKSKTCVLLTPENVETYLPKKEGNN
jgi:hypothetical protein